MNEKSPETSARPKLQVIHVITDLELGGAEMMLFRLLAHMDKETASSLVISLGREAILNLTAKNVDV